MDITVKGLRHPHRYVLDAAQTHIYMLMKKVGGLCGGRAGAGRTPTIHLLDVTLGVFHDNKQPDSVVPYFQTLRYPITFTAATLPLEWRFFNK